MSLFTSFSIHCTIHWPNMMNSGASTCQLGVVPYWNIAVASFITAYYHIQTFISKLHCHIFVINDLFFLHIPEQLGIIHYHNYL